MSTKLVTAFFSFHEGFPIYGQNQTRVDRYLHSLASIAKTGEEIICYIEEKNLKIYEEFWDRFGKEHGWYDIYSFENLTFKYITLDDFKHTKRMYEIKEKHISEDDISNYKMFHEIDWFKLQLLEQEIDDQHDYFYWIDCGLSHAGLFPNRVAEDPLANAEFKAPSTDFRMYNFTKIFNPNLFPKINQFIEDKLLGITTTLVYWDINSLVEVLKNANYASTDINYYDNFQSSHSIGGIIGGHKSKIKEFITEFNKISQLSLDNEIIPNHEVIMSAIKWHNPEWFKVYEFDIWYHEDSYLTMGALMVEPEWQKNAIHIKQITEEKRQFFGFFHEIGLDI